MVKKDGTILCDSTPCASAATLCCPVPPAYNSSGNEPQWLFRPKAISQRHASFSCCILDQSCPGSRTKDGIPLGPGESGRDSFGGSSSAKVRPSARCGVEPRANFTQIKTYLLAAKVNNARTL